MRCSPQLAHRGDFSMENELTAPGSVLAPTRSPTGHPKERFYPGYSLPRTFSTSLATPFIQAGLKELKEIFNLELPVKSDDEEKDLAGFVRRGMIDSTAQSSTTADLGNEDHVVSTIQFHSCSTDEGHDHFSATRTLGCSFLASTLCWSAALAWILLQQDFELVSPSLLFPAFLPLPLSFAATSLLFKGLTPTSIEILYLLSKVYKAHVILQGLISVAIWTALGTTAVYPEGHGQSGFQIGSVRSQATFLAATMAQAALPLAAVLWVQWKLATALRQNITLRASGFSGCCQPVLAMLHSTLGVESDELPYADPLPISPESAVLVSSPLAKADNLRRTIPTAESVKCNSRGLWPAHKTHRSLRPTAAAADTTAASPSPPLPLTTKNQACCYYGLHRSDMISQRYPFHRRSQSQPLMSWDTRTNALVGPTIRIASTKSGFSTRRLSSMSQSSSMPCERDDSNLDALEPLAMINVEWSDPMAA